MARIDALLRQVHSQVDAVDAELLLAHVLQRPRAWLHAHSDETLQETLADRFQGLVSRRESGEPVAYLIGHRGFWRFDLAVTPATLIPRPETELLVELALQQLPAAHTLQIADLGTGSGAIALALALERPQARVVATDASADALVIASANAVQLGIGNLQLRLGDWLEPLAGDMFDLIVSNPPYIATGDPHLDLGDLRFEPRAALVSGADGLDAIRTIVREAPAHLHSQGWLLLEHGWDQGQAVRALMQSAGLVDIRTERDLEDRDRVSLARKPL